MPSDTPTTGTNWAARAACKWRPGQVDLWYSTIRNEQRLAVHICLSHCPVFVQCDADRKANPCGYGVHAGVLYGYQPVDPQPVVSQPNPDTVPCPTCDAAAAAAAAAVVVPAVAVVSRKPPTLFADCGTPAAYKRHLKRDEQPDDACRAANTRRKAAYAATPKSRNTGARSDNAVYQTRVATTIKCVELGMCDREIGEKLGISVSAVYRIRVANRIPAGMPVGGVRRPRRKRRPSAQPEASAA